MPVTKHQHLILWGLWSKSTLKNPVQQGKEKFIFRQNFARFEVFTAMNIEVEVFSVVTPYIFVVGYHDSEVHTAYILILKM
jgi:hypothetical protein